jgi:excisionase family DNA binding protein
MLQSASLRFPGVTVTLKRDWMTMTEVAEALGVNRTTAWRWIDAGQLKIAKKQTPGGRWLYSRADLEAWLKSADK